MNKSFFHSGWLLISLLLVLASCTTGKLGKNKQKKLDGKVIVITGASSGLGRGVALQAAEYKAIVVLVARSTQVLNQLADSINSAGGQALAVTADVSKLEDLQQVLEQTISRFGKIDMWINNAGVAAIGSFTKTPLEDHLRVLDVNLNGVFRGSYIAVEQFKKQGYGTLVNIGSVESQVPTAYQTSYGASKAGVRAMGLVLRQELRLEKQKNIKVVTVSPWAIDTPLWDNVATYTGHEARMTSMDRTQKAVNVVMHALLSKKREMPIGFKSHATYGLHRIFPGWVERIGANMAHKHQASDTPPKADTTGNLYTPTGSGKVDGGFKQKMKEEKRAQRD
ncbi:MAG TPA: SDR family NAD(P)-dependent oxidoreductase [Flavihumibacter sp.]|jgi:short-subunit dehydrogenase